MPRWLQTFKAFGYKARSHFTRCVLSTPVVAATSHLRAPGTSQHANSYPCLLWMATTFAAGLCGAVTSSVCSCDFKASTEVLASPDRGAVESFLSWLEEHGGAVSAVDLRHSENQSARLVVFANNATCSCYQRGWLRAAWCWVSRNNKPAVIATFPLELSLTAQTAIQQRITGHLYQELLELDVVDERMLVVLFLLVERLKGNESLWASWLNVLPKNLDIPLFYRSEELEELKGTALYRATVVKKRQLEAMWQRLEPAVRDILLAAKVPCAPTWEDFMWAYGIFWSRSMSLPVSPKAESLSTRVPSPVEVSTTLMDSSRLSGPLQGVVPGLDMCNHNARSPCWWTIDGAPATKASPQPAPREACLVCDRRSQLRPGQEVTISYGDKSNEELLFIYGFTENVNLNDQLMVSCPLPPPDEWDDVMSARMSLMQRRGLRPQFFLPAILLEADQQGSTKGANAGKPASAPPLLLPEPVLPVLRFLVMEPRQVAAELQEQVAQSGTEPQRTAVEESGLQMAALTTLVRLLEMTVVSLEGEEGTGLLEADVQLLEKEHLPPKLRDCVVYRASQKRLAREYLVRARAELNREMQKLEGLLNE